MPFRLKEILTMDDPQSSKFIYYQITDNFFAFQMAAQRIMIISVDFNNIRLFLWSVFVINDIVNKEIVDFHLPLEIQVETLQKRLHSYLEQGSFFILVELIFYFIEARFQQQTKIGKNSLLVFMIDLTFFAILQSRIEKVYQLSFIMFLLKYSRQRLHIFMIDQLSINNNEQLFRLYILYPFLLYFIEDFSLQYVIRLIFPKIKQGVNRYYLQLFWNVLPFLSY